MSTQRFAPGQTIIRQGEPGDHFHIITRGTVEYITTDADGNELILDSAGERAFFGELSMITGEMRAIKVRAMDQVDTLALDRKQFFEFLSTHASSAIEILKVLGERLSATDKLLRQSVSKNANEVISAKQTIAQKFADWFAEMMGSWTFIILQSIILIIWIALNVVAWFKHFDEPPFLLLDFVLAVQAAYTAPIIMMSQNRAADKDRLVADVDHQVNIRAEIKTGLIMSRLDDLERSMHFLHSEQTTILKSIRSEPT